MATRFEDATPGQLQALRSQIGGERLCELVEQRLRGTTRRRTRPAAGKPEAQIRLEVKAWYRLQGAVVIDTEQQRPDPRVDAGLADLVVAWPGRGIRFVEVKSATGKQRDSQRAFEAAVKAAGGIYWLVRSVEDVMELEDRV